MQYLVATGSILATCGSFRKVAVTVLCYLCKVKQALEKKIYNMASECLGNFGVYRDVWRELSSNQNKDTVWVTKRYTPIDLRSTAPVPRHKLISADYRTLPAPADHWLPSLGGSAMYRDTRQSQMYPSHPSTRSEEWSTLREMLPSRGFSGRVHPANWGTGNTPPPSMSGYMPRRFAHLNSPMTRYVDDMHLTNRLFNLH